MYHSVNFEQYNTWDTWHLIPTSRPRFSIPQIKTQFTDLTNTDGQLDDSETLGIRAYQNISGEFEFAVENGFRDWVDLYTDLLDKLHGNRFYTWLEDEPTYSYYLRLSVNAWESPADGTWSLVRIGYNGRPIQYPRSG